MPEARNHCPLCGKEIEPEESLCKECAADDLKPCPVCGKIVCDCETGEGD